MSSYENCDRWVRWKLGHKDCGMSIFRCAMGTNAVASLRKRLAMRVEFLANTVRSI